MDEEELMKAQERLIRKREEERMTAQEELGYLSNTNQKNIPPFQKKKDKEISKDLSPLQENRIRVMYLSGVAKGLTHILRADIAEELIASGIAIRVK